jgi:hypothetical protein
VRRRLVKIFAQAHSSEGTIFILLHLRASVEREGGGERGGGRRLREGERETERAMNTWAPFVPQRERRVWGGRQRRLVPQRERRERHTQTHTNVLKSMISLPLSTTHSPLHPYT